MIYALVKNGVVINTTEWDGNSETWTPPSGFSAVLATGGAGVGWTYDGETFSPPQIERKRAGNRQWFRSLFTFEEQSKIEVMRAHVNAMTTGQLLAAPNLLALKTFLAIFNDAEEINLDFAQTQLGVSQILTATYDLGEIEIVILTAEAANSVLAGETRE